MCLPPERGVPPDEHPLTRSNGLEDWNSARILLEVVRRGSFRSAADRLGMSINSVRRRIDEFEGQIGAQLVTRDAHGTRLIDENARAVVLAAERMESAAGEMLRVGRSLAREMSGAIRVAVDEMLGTFWLAPRLIEFQELFPNIQVDLQYAALGPADRLKADIAIHLSQPADAAQTTRLGRLHSMFYASKAYIAAFGAPTEPKELSEHRIVLQAADRGMEVTDFESWLTRHTPADPSIIKTNIGSASYLAVVAGTGIGILPTCAGIWNDKILPLEIELRQPKDIWLSCDRPSRSAPRVAQMIDWIVDSFDSQKFPCFDDEFIHPREFKWV